MTSKEKIIHASTKLFWLRGYKNTSINDIIQKAEVSKGSFFHHFPDKKALFKVVIDYFYQIDMHAFLTFKEPLSPKEKIITFCKRVDQANKTYSFKGGCLLGNFAIELSDIDEDFRQKIKENFNTWENELVQIIQKISTKKTPEDIARFIISSIQGTTMTSKVYKDEKRYEKEFSLFMDILCILLEEKK